MKGSIEYLRKLREICKDHKGDCKGCPLGKYKKVTDCDCPRLIHPSDWSDKDIAKMVRI